jgi:hypothetical protein
MCAPEYVYGMLLIESLKTGRAPQFVSTTGSADPSTVDIYPGPHQKHLRPVMGLGTFLAMLWRSSAWA